MTRPMCSGREDNASVLMMRNSDVGSSGCPSYEEAISPTTHSATRTDAEVMLEMPNAQVGGVNAKRSGRWG